MVVTADIIAEATAVARVDIRQAGTGAIRQADHADIRQADTMGIQQADHAATRQMVRACIQRADRGALRAHPVAIERQRQDIRRPDNRHFMDRIRRPLPRQRGLRA